MAHLIGDLAKYFTLDEINIDNAVFKLFYKGSVMLFFMGSLVGVLSQYFGEPINCDFKGIEGELASDYCWIHGSSFIPPEYQPHMKCIVDLDGVISADDAPDTSYYQWVTFMMLFQAGITLLPYKIWCMCEGELIKSFGTDAKSAVILTSDSKYDDGVVMDAVVEKYVKYFKSILHHNNWYFVQFVICECLNFILLFANFWATDKFLQGRFRYYGWDVIMYYQLSRAEQKLAVNPFCATFPTEVSCTVPNIGAAGGAQDHNGLCVLSQNVINEKVYLVVWFWLTFLVLVTFFFVIYRICTIFFDNLRYALIFWKIRHKYDPEIQKSVEYVLSKCHIGDWFVLYQLSKNVNLYFYREFMKELKRELMRKPKRSKSLEAKKQQQNTMNANCVGRNNPPGKISDDTERNEEQGPLLRVDSNV